ncbi:MAG: cytochrome c biogenesis protein CcdC [Anaerolineales bacterium]|nr:cytochrome c biogenesis protein CcdC [Anaerolineales bacterium]
MTDIFEKYLTYRFQRAGAVTPGQKLDVLREVRADAERGQVPTDERTVVTLDTADPNVQAVLRGESVSIGMGAPVRRRSIKSAASPETRKKLIAPAIFMLLSILLFVMLGVRSANNKKASAAAESGAEGTPTMDTLALIALTQTAMAEPTKTAVSPTATFAVATPTQDSVLYAPVPGEAGQDPTNPASIELGGRLFILQQGEVDKKTGIWNPQQPEWLAETVLRRVFALPRSYLENAGITPGGHIMLRLRNGELVDYVITTILQIPLNQIEVLKSNRPSIVILTIDETNGQAPTVDRLVVVGEVPVPVQPEEMQDQAKDLSGIVRYSGMGYARLRKDPSLTGEVIDLLPPDTVISIPYPTQRTEGDGVTWVFVQSAVGSGWMAEDLIIYRP